MSTLPSALKWVATSYRCRAFKAGHWPIHERDIVRQEQAILTPSTGVLKCLAKLRTGARARGRGHTRGASGMDKRANEGASGLPDVQACPVLTDKAGFGILPDIVDEQH